jgi:hypothetical protein
LEQPDYLLKQTVGVFMRTHRFGRKIKLPSTIAIRHQIKKSMLEDALKAEAAERTKAIPLQPEERPPVQSL